MRSNLKEIQKKVLDTKEMFYLTKEEQYLEKFGMIKTCFNYHYNNNEFYKTFCQKENFSPEDLNGFKDLEKIPLIPQSYFKDENYKQLFTVPIEDTVLEIRSSGTEGTQSITHRDKDTVDTIFFALYKLFSEITGIHEGAGLFLTPSIAEAPHLGMLRTLGVLNAILNTQDYGIKNSNFDFENSVNFLKKWEGKYTRHIFAPPFMLKFFLDYLKNNNIKLKLDENTKILTTGGWKKYTGHIIPRYELDDLCQEYLGVKKENLRDFYGTIESNIIAIENENNEKLIPPYSHFYLKDMNDLSKTAEKGEEGILAVLDPLNFTFPAFLLTEDIALLDDERIRSCGRMSKVINLIGRAPNKELKSCAITLEQYIDNKIDRM